MLICAQCVCAVFTSTIGDGQVDVLFTNMQIYLFESVTSITSNEACCGVVREKSMAISWRIYGGVIVALCFARLNVCNYWCARVVHERVGSSVGVQSACGRQQTIVSTYIQGMGCKMGGCVRTFIWRIKSSRLTYVSSGIARPSAWQSNSKRNAWPEGWKLCIREYWCSFMWCRCDTKGNLYLSIMIGWSWMKWLIIVWRSARTVCKRW